LSGLAYAPGAEPGSGTLVLSDSEHDESPYNSSTNLWALQTDGTFTQSYGLTSFTKEPTGLAYDPVAGYVFISDDRSYKVHWVDPDNPTVKLGEFLTEPLGGSDPEDVAVGPDGHLFICNGSGNTNTPGIIETDQTGTQVFDFIAMPSVITDSEALAYDAIHDVFYVGGKFSANIWVIDRDGTILETIDILASYPREDGGARARVTDLELAPSSDPSDGAKLSLYVADYGADQANDGRLFEIDLGDPFWA
jgi:DNA-binding beta-propeller fold protein YncE